MRMRNWTCPRPRLLPGVPDPNCRMLSALDALNRLREGNQRFASVLRNTGGESGQARRRKVAEAQEPSAISLGCSDSRVPPAIVFDQGLGDLFVIRVAGTSRAPL